MKMDGFWGSDLRVLDRLPLWSEDKVFLKIAPIIGFDLIV
jgi:hypothetical protein